MHCASLDHYGSSRVCEDILEHAPHESNATASMRVDDKKSLLKGMQPKQETRRQAQASPIEILVGHRFGDPGRWEVKIRCYFASCLRLCNKYVRTLGLWRLQEIYGVQTKLTLFAWKHLD